MANNPVKITVTMSPLKVSVDQDPVPLGGFTGVEWTFATPGWEFTLDADDKSTGIEIKNPGNKFKDKKGDKTKHEWQRKRADGQTYRYTISIVQSAYPDLVVTWDPQIMNN